MRRALAPAALLVVVACSSTTADAPVRTGDAAVVRSAVPSPPAPAESAAAPLGVRRARASAAPKSGSPSSRSVATQGPRVVRESVGVDAKTIRIGARYVTGDEAFTRTIGAEGVSAGDHRGMYQAVFDFINTRRGGIAGRKIVPFYYPYDITRIAEAQAQQEAACRSWTEDHHVFAAVSSAPSGNNIATCMTKHRTPLVQDTVQFYFDEQIFRETKGYLMMPASPNGSKLARFWVDGLVKQKFFAKSSKVGIVRLNSPAHERVTNQVLKPRLRSYGHPVAAEAVLERAEDIGAGVLKFRAAGVTHALMVDDGGLVSLLWMTQAESQGFRPRYGLTSVSAPSALLHQNVSHSQLRGSMGVGWVPTADVLKAQEPADKAKAKLCDRIMRDRGVDTSARTEVYLSRVTCDVALFFEQAVEPAPTFTPAGLRSSVDKLGGAFDPAASFRSRFGPGRYAGTSGVRNFAFTAGCDCFRYTSAVYAVD